MSRTSRQSASASSERDAAARRAAARPASSAGNRARARSRSAVNSRATSGSDVTREQRDEAARGERHRAGHRRERRRGRQSRLARAQLEQLGAARAAAASSQVKRPEKPRGSRLERRAAATRGSRGTASSSRGRRSDTRGSASPTGCTRNASPVSATPSPEPSVDREPPRGERRLAASATSANSPIAPKPNTKPPCRLHQSTISGGHSHGAQGRSRVSRTMPTKSSVTSCGRMSRNQYEVAAAAQSAAPAPNDEPQWRRATTNATAKIANEKREVRPGDELRVELVGEPVAGAPEPLVVHPGPAGEGEREVVDGRQTARARQISRPAARCHQRSEPATDGWNQAAAPSSAANAREPPIDFRHPFE